MAVAEEYVLQFKADINDLKGKLSNAKGSVEGLNRSSKDLEKTFFNLGKKIGGAFAISKILGDFKQAVYRMDEMADAAERLGISSEAFSELAYSAKIFDVELGQLQNSLKFMQINMAEAATKGGAAGAAFEALGLNISNLINLPANEQFYQIIQALEGVENSALRTALAQDVFGKSSQGVLDLVAQGSNKLREMGIEASNTGNILSGEMAAKAGKLKEDLQKLDSTYQGMLMSISDRGGFDIATAAITDFNIVLGEFLSILGTASNAWNDFIASLEFKVGKDSSLGVYAKQVTALENGVTDMQKRLGNPFLETATRAKFQKELDRRKGELAKAHAAAAEANSKPFIPQVKAATPRTAVFTGGGSSGGGSSKSSTVDPLTELLKGTASAKMEEYQQQIELVNDSYAKGRVTLEQQEEIIGGIREDMDRLNKNEVTDFTDGLVEGMFKGIRSWDDFKRAGINALTELAIRAAKDLFSGGKSKGGGIAESLSGGLGSIGKYLWDALPSFDTGGMTGNGVGGANIDGKGGFPAILHPNEAVLNRNQMKGMGGGANVTQNIVINATAPADIDRRIMGALPRFKQEAMAGVQAAMGAGGSMSKAVGKRL